MVSRIRLANDRIFTFDRMEMMGIVNVTDDSFYEGSRANSTDAALKLAQRHIAQGAAMIDVGGESTRPGSKPVSEETEIGKICPVIAAIRQRHPEIIISADTYRAGTARAAIDAGADMINDISGFTFEPKIAEVIGETGAAAVIMHTGGRPDTMQDDPHYDDVVGEVYGFLGNQIEYAVSCGIGKDQIMIDVGIGFGKNDEHNLALLRDIDRFSKLGCPHLMAVSRKSLIGRTLANAGSARPEDHDPGNRLAGTISLTAYGAMHRIEAARVHDVRENLEAARMIEAVMGKAGSNLEDTDK